MDSSSELYEIFRAIDLLGVLLNGIIGGRLAREKKFDLIGFMVLAVMSALAGGMLRDVLLAAGPPVALTDPFYLPTALLGALVAFLWRLDGKWSRRAMLLADGIVLGAWAAVGAAKTLGLGFGVIPAILLGLTTAVGGGMIRDVAAGNVPLVFGGNNLYATPALTSAAVLVSFAHFGFLQTGMVAATLVGSAFTILAHWRRWQLPRHEDWSLSITRAQLRALRAAGRRQQSRLKKDYAGAGEPGAGDRPNWGENNGPAGSGENDEYR